jgi:predicted dinucleotide-binding enzyme
MESVDPGLLAARNQSHVEVLHGTAQKADAVLLAVHWSQIDDVLKHRNPLFTTDLASN